MTIYGWSPYVPVSLIAAVTVAGVAIWLGILHLMDHPLSHEIQRLLARTRVTGFGTGIS